MRKILLTLCFLWAVPGVASHIVGGEFEVIHVSGNQYRINLILYFDEINGSEGARDPNVEARIFRKRDNWPMMDVFLPLTEMTPVGYTQPECASDEIQISTTRIVYTALVTLSSQHFSDPEGYYISWERCCRNYAITNMYSDNPTTSGRYAGQTFYLEFPPVVKDGRPFINSSPRLFPPLNDFACPYRPYYVDFSGVDDDGDSLVYSLVTPLNTKTADALPLPDYKPRPAPYPEVLFRPPYSNKNITGGSPDLWISPDGLLTVTPTLQGLFVFAVKCEEYRDGVKIGEVRRDFQLAVVDGCGPAEIPRIVGKKADNDAISYEKEMHVEFSSAVTDADRCILVEVSDPDASHAGHNFSENVRIRAIPLGFKADVSDILPEVTQATITEGETASFQICFDRCPYVRGEPFQIAIIAYDDACSVPLTDTLKVTVNIEPPPNSPVEFLTPDVTAILTEGDSRRWPIHLSDDDGDELMLEIKTDGFDLAAAGIRIESVVEEDGSYQAELVWDAYCDIYDFTGQTSFEIVILGEDVDECLFADPAYMVFDLSVNLPDNTEPVISSDLSPEELANGIVREIYQSLSFNITGTDDDGDLLSLYVVADGFDTEAHGINFAETAGVGVVTASFDWTLLCQNIDLSERDIFPLLFVVMDNNNKCRIPQADSLYVTLVATAPQNSPPILSVASANPDHLFMEHRQEVLLGQPISLNLTAVDSDVAPVDRLVIELVESEGRIPPEGFVFENGEGLGRAESNFEWSPDCSIFSDGIFENDYRFTFRVYDDRCQHSMADTVVVEMTIRDREHGIRELLPPNFVSADYDPGSKNEFFGMVRLDESTGTLQNIMPEDNCTGRFIGITIYNRWGSVVFSSEDRHFRWYPYGEAAGIYYYTMKFSDKEYKGLITVRN